jgi:Fic family protein
VSEIRDLSRSLDGSPYLLDESAAGKHRAEFLLKEAGRIEDRQRAVEERFSRESEEIQRRLSQMAGTRLVYESNALELTGLPLAQTEEAISAAPTAPDELAAYIAAQAVHADRHLVDVLGLHQATVFARRLADDFARSSVPIREVDIRSLHAATVPTEPFAGSYRSIEVGIEGSHHTPPSVLEVRREMAQLVDWLNTTSASPPLAAAVVHSWLTIIHPFQDGNGRIARLLANIVLLRVGWPPLIVRASDRLQYLDALSGSDEAGDLLPLFDLFVKSIKRGLRELEKPDLARRLYEADLHRDADLRHGHWANQLDCFLEALREALLPAHFTLDRLAAPGRSTLLLLEEGDTSGNTWLAKARHPDGRDFLLWLGTMTHEMRDNWGVSSLAPSLFIAERDRRWGAVHPYANSFTSPPRVPINEISFLPHLHHCPALVRRGILVVDRSIEEAATGLAEAVIAAPALYSLYTSGRPG